MDNTTAPNTQASPVSQRHLAFEFRGKGGEYFKIWIVNILLSILTLGIYSAWAKVRSARYFYSNLYLDNANFRYLANPITILKGRLIAIAALIVFILSAQYAPALYGVFSVVLLFAIPYFIIRSLAFNHRMSAYKNIQFRFKGQYGEAFMALYIWPLLGLLTLGILYPLAILRINQFITRNSSYGTTKFDFTATYRDYGMILLVIVIWLIAAALAMFVIQKYTPGLGPVASGLLLLVYFISFVYFIVCTTNLYYRSLILAEHSFDANLTMGGLAKVYLINGLLIIITIGLYLPAAKVNITRYICSNISMNAQGSLDNFAAAEKENISALGEEFGEVFDFGI